MTDKEFVKSIYPGAMVDPNYLAGYSVYHFEYGEPVAVIPTNDEDEVWRRMRLYLERKMLRKFEQ